MQKYIHGNFSGKQKSQVRFRDARKLRGGHRAFGFGSKIDQSPQDVLGWLLCVPDARRILAGRSEHRAIPAKQHAKGLQPDEEKKIAIE